MITTSFYLDVRGLDPTQEAPLKVSITKSGSTTYIPLGISLLRTQWDKVAKKVLAHPRKAYLNSYLAQRKLDIDEAILSISKRKGAGSMSVTDVKKAVLAILNPEEPKRESFYDRLIRYAESSNPRTRDLYLATARRLQDFCKGIKSLSFEEISVDWLNEFDSFLKQTSPARNARNIHYRNIRAVFNDARRNGLTTNYPFDKGKFEIRAERTRKRSFKVEVLRNLFSANLEPHQERYRDVFKLIFMLIGINFVDLCGLVEVEDGRVEYTRAKTKRPYSIKVEPEAQEIISRLQGEKHLLYLSDRYANYRVAYMQVCKGLAQIKEKIGIPELSSYWARHSWATIAASLDIPRDTIAAALGHGGNTVTDIYIDFDQRKVDEANRKVLDWVLYGKR